MNLEKISEISNVFESFKQDPNAIYKTLANISKTDLTETHQYYTAKSKHFKICPMVLPPDNFQRFSFSCSHFSGSS